MFRTEGNVVPIDKSLLSESLLPVLTSFTSLIKVSFKADTSRVTNASSTLGLYTVWTIGISCSSKFANEFSPQFE